MCFRSLLLVGCSQFEATTIGEVKFTPKVFPSNALQYFYQQLMAEAPKLIL